MLRWWRVMVWELSCFVPRSKTRESASAGLSSEGIQGKYCRACTANETPQRPSAPGAACCSFKRDICSKPLFGPCSPMMRGHDFHAYHCGPSTHRVGLKLPRSFITLNCRTLNLHAQHVVGRGLERQLPLCLTCWE